MPFCVDETNTLPNAKDKGSIKFRYCELAAVSCQCSMS